MSFDRKLEIVEEVLGVKLMNYQKKMLQMMLNGYQVQWARGCGKTIVRDAYLLMLAMEKEEKFESVK